MGQEKVAAFLDLFYLLFPLCKVDFQFAFVDTVTNCVHRQWFLCSWAHAVISASGSCLFLMHLVSAHLLLILQSPIIAESFKTLPMTTGIILEISDHNNVISSLHF